MVARHPRFLIIVGVTITWITFSSITQIVNKRVLLDGNSPWNLLTLQMLCGTLVYYITSQSRNREKGFRGVLNLLSLNCCNGTLESKIWLLVIGLCNALAHLLTLYAIGMITPALTHIIRGTEPIWLIMFSYIMLKKGSSLHELMSVGIMILGVIAISNGGTKSSNNQHQQFIAGILTTLAANIAISIRNCGTKKYTVLTLKELHYPEVCCYSLVWVLYLYVYPTIAMYIFAKRDTLHLGLILWIKTNVFDVFKNGFSTYLLVASVFHVVYSTMSFYVLSFMEPTSHSIVKLVSRTTAVITLTIAYGIEEPNKLMILGIMLSVSGAIFFTSSSSIMAATRKYLKISSLLISVCSFICLYVFMSTSKIDPAFNINDDQCDPLDEAGLSTSISYSNFRYPIIPISGYRRCLNGSDILNSSRLHPMVYIGNRENSCKGCTQLDMSKSFCDLSMVVCNSKALYCGIGSTFSCGLLGMHTKTTVYVSPGELQTWPDYMQDYVYGGMKVHEIEYNHRLVFDRHTIKQSNQLVLDKFNVLTSIRRGFDLFFYTRQDECNKTTNKHAPLSHGNIGDIFGSHLSEYFSRGANLNYSLLCFDDKYSAVNEYFLTFAFVGSIARYTLKRPNTVLLGVGTLRPEETKMSKLKTLQNIHVIGVRGPRTRDAFLSKYGLNPEVVGDPGLYFYTVFKKEVDEARKRAPFRKELCLISHEEDTEEFELFFRKYRNITISANEEVKTFVDFVATCNAVVSSSLHGVVFSHSLSIPVMPVKASDKLAGGDWKFYDYYYGINVTTFHGRHIVKKSRLTRIRNDKEWISLVKAFPQPTFPINLEGLSTYRILKSIFRNIGVNR